MNTSLERLDSPNIPQDDKFQPTHAAGDSLRSFLYAIPSKSTKKRYITQLGYFFDFLKIEGKLDEQASKFLAIAKEDHKQANDCLIDYVTYLKNRVDAGEITGGTVGNYYTVVKLFYEQNDLELNWKRIERGMPETGAIANDRAPTLEKIRKIIEYPDRRIKVIVCVMVSSGIRIGAWESLKLKHLAPLYSPQNDKVIVAAKLSVYEGRPKPYITFVSPEAYQAVQDYVEFRKLHGEKITPESWILRDKFETTADGPKQQQQQQSGGIKTSGLPTVPKKLQPNGVKKILVRAMRSQGIRQSLDKDNGQKRHEFKLAHGYRKYFKSNAERVMRPINVELLMDHKIGISDSYYRPTEQDLLEDYLKAVDYLSVNRDQKIATQLQRQFAEVTSKNEQEVESLKKQLEETEAKMTILQANTSKVMEVLMGQTNELKLYAWNGDDGPIETAKMIEAEMEKRKEKRKKEKGKS